MKGMRFASWELYDLRKDPQEVNNVYADPRYAGMVNSLKKDLKDLRVKYKDNMPVAN